MYENQKCLICKGNGFIQCEQCYNPSFFCSKEHLIMHKQKTHRANSVSNNNKIRNNFDNNLNNNSNSNNNNNYPDNRQLYDYQNSLKKEIFNKMSNQDYSSAIPLIKQYINTSKQYDQEDNPANIEMLYTLAECNLNLSNLEESKNVLNELLLLIEASHNNNYMKENIIFFL